MSDEPPKFSLADERTLKRLVAAYGKKRVAQRAMTLRASKRGRPPTIRPSDEIAMLDWIEARAKEDGGTRKVLRQIYNQLADSQELPDFEDWEPRMKEALRQARRAVEDQAEIDDLAKRHNARRRESK